MCLFNNRAHSSTTDNTVPLSLQDQQPRHGSRGQFLCLSPAVDSTLENQNQAVPSKQHHTVLSEAQKGQGNSFSHNFFSYFQG